MVGMGIEVGMSEQLWFEAELSIVRPLTDKQADNQGRIVLQHAPGRTRR